MNDILPRWEWSMGSDVFRSTPMWPELLGTVGVVVLALTVALHARGRESRRPLAVVLLVLGAWSVPALALLAAGTLVLRNHAAFSGAFGTTLAPLALVVASTGLAAGFFLGLGLSKRTSAIIVAEMALGALLTVVPVGHALFVAMSPWADIEVESWSPRQHVGLSQEIIGDVSSPGWHMTRSHETIEGRRTETRRVELVAERHGDRVRRVLEVRVAEERGPALMPLAEGSWWTWHVRSLDGAWGPRDETLSVTGRRSDGALHRVVVEAQGREREVYAFDGALYVMGGRVVDGHDDTQPFFAEPRADGSNDELEPARSLDGPVQIELLGLTCGRVATSGGELGLPGPTDCVGRRQEGLSGSQVFAAIFTLGVALPFMHTPVHPVEATLVRSERADEPAFEVPVS